MKEQNNTAENNKYKWMKPFQRELYLNLCEEFNFKNLTDLGNFLGLNNPYHGAKLIFEAQKQNIYLKKIVEVKRSSRLKIDELESTLQHISGFRSSIESSLEQLNSSISSIEEIKKSFE
jgi:hypothetical protein